MDSAASPRGLVDRPWLESAATTASRESEVSRAFREWCQEADLAADYDAPHWQAFHAGYEAGVDDEYHVKFAEEVEAV